MERDFMGLLPKSLTVKQETDDGYDSAPMRGSGMQWSFSNSTNASHILSFKSAQEQGGSHKLYPPGFSQRKVPLDKQGGNQYPTTSHQWPHNGAHSVNHPQTNQRVPAAISSSILQPHLAPDGPNVMGPTVGRASVSIPTPYCPIVGSTDLKSSPRTFTGPSQLTIFYNGSVCVYDSVSPEKAQAIMLLAGNGDSANSSAMSVALSAAHKLTPPVSRPQASDCTIPTQPLSFSSSISLSPPVSSLSVVPSSCVTEVNPVKPVTTPAHMKSPEPPKSSGPFGSGGLNNIQSAVPQARKASLARFLERRKERVVNASPYAVSKNSSECSSVEPGRSTFATNTATSSPLPASN